MSREWVGALRVGDVIHARYNGYDEPLVVVREAIRTRQRWAILVKRQHLKVAMPMNECDDDYVMYQWSSKVGQTHNKFRDWLVSREGELLSLPLHSPTHPSRPSSHEQTTPVSFDWETSAQYALGLQRVLQSVSHAVR